MSKKPPQPQKDEKKPQIKEEKPKFDEIIFNNLSNPQMNFDHSGFVFTRLSMEVFHLIFL